MSIPRVIAGLLFLFIFVSLLYFYFGSIPDRSQHQKHIYSVWHKAKPLLFFSTLFAIAMEALTLWGMRSSNPLVIEDWSRRRVAIFFVFGIVVAIVVRLAFVRLVPVLRNQLSKSDNRRDRVRVVILLAASFLMLLGLGILYVVVGHASSLIYLSACVVVVVVFVVMLLQWRSFTPLAGFLLISFAIGSFFVFCIPPSTGFSWDDGIHFDRSLGISYFGSAELSPAEVEMAVMPWNNTTGEMNYSLLYESLPRLDEQYSDAADLGQIEEVHGWISPVFHADLISISMVGNIPNALGIWMGRLLHLSLSGLVLAGRLFNLLTYIAITGTAIAIAPSKKWCFSSIGLLPTNLFLAASFSYDPWVISCLILFTSLASRLISSNVRISFSRLLPCLVVLALGLASKAIYFLLAGILLLVPKGRLGNAGQKRRYYAALLVFTLAMILSFVLPLLFTSSGNTGDVRGGSDVSSIGQIKYFFTDPLGFLATIGFFVIGYLSPLEAGGYAVYTAYLGFIETIVPFLSLVPLSCIVATALFDPDSESGPSFSVFARCYLVFIFLASVVLVATALYVSFTPVGFWTVNGCSPRYILPLLAPLMLGVGSSRVSDTRVRLLLARGGMMLTGATGFAVCMFVVFQL